MKAIGLLLAIAGVWYLLQQRQDYEDVVSKFRESHPDPTKRLLGPGQNPGGDKDRQTGGGKAWIVM